MPEVITDTSPIQYLYQVNLLDLLPTLYGQVIMPQAVANELDQGRTQGVALRDPVSLAWIILRQVQASTLVPSLPELGLGEREVLTLAVATTDSLVILDDDKINRMDRREGEITQLLFAVAAYLGNRYE